ncbi:Mfa1 family fimbria major subunit [uncultured Parabacteroides sp.]|jgi:hypothetical protein|uniref:Mfa1 family fimbria major subunit n=1 Tax=uncultured Parabacteroides sp. TaxID=512312 RepID=UPI0025E8E458|nr:Mfa1 family fimbria major subunit [uncultured Parabacteroides sp.]
MKIKTLFSIALTAAVLAGCNNSDEILNAEETQGKGYVSMNITYPQQSSGRSVSDTKAVNTGTPDENNINTLQIYYFDGFSDNAKVVAIKDIDPKNTPYSGTHSVPVTAKAMMVVANAIETPALGMTLASINRVLTADNVSDLIGGTGKNSFIMTNSKGGLEPSLSNGSDKELTLYADEATAVRNTLKVRIDRVVSKVVVKAATAGIPTDVGNAYVALKKWDLNVLNKKYYLMSKRTKTYFEGLANNWVWSTNDPYHLGSYRIDPNYTGQTLASQKDNYTIHTGTIDDLPSAKDAGVADYCLENTQDKKDNVKAYATQVLIMAEWTPKTVTDVDGSSVALNPGDSFFSINGILFSKTTLLNTIEAEVTNKLSNSDPSTYVTKYTDALNAYLVNCLKVTAVTIPTSIPSGSSAENEARIVRDAFDNAEYYKKGGQWIDVPNNIEINFYHESMSYYSLPVKHDFHAGTPGAVNELGKFGVVRNCSYVITLNKILNIGSPVIPDPDDENLEVEEKYLNATIEINPWGVYEYGEEL